MHFVQAKQILINSDEKIVTSSVSQSSIAKFATEKRFFIAR